jgi:crotonobetainyl-CoA:carnitine CoA-transferase CaiB-like acyl-CoA transferase
VTAVTIARIEADMAIETNDGSVGTSSLPLNGVRVLDLSTRIGAYCGKLLADLGADVIKVERPTGDQLRRTPPFRRGALEGESGLLFAWYNNNKRGITLDWTRLDAVPLLAELASSADVVVVSPDRREPLATFEEAEPHLTWVPQRTTLCAITPFGLTGPWRHWRATPFTSFASSGQMHAIGPDEGPPWAMPGQQLYDMASTRAAGMVVAILAGNAPAQTIDVSAQEVGAWQYHVIQRFNVSGRIMTRATNFGPPPGGVWKCRDGSIDIAAHSAHHWVVFVELLGNPEDLVEPLYRERGMRAQLFDLLTPIIADHLAEKSAPELVKRGQAMGLPCALRYRPEEFLEDEQPHARGAFVDVCHPELGMIRLPGPAVQADPPLLTYRRPAPSLGESNRQVFVDQLGHDEIELEEWRARGLV